MRVAQGGIHAVIGPNGAGKTTLFNLVSGLLPPTSGRIVLAGQDVTRLPAHRRADAGGGAHLPEHPHLRRHDGAGERAHRAARHRPRQPARGDRPPAPLPPPGTGTPSSGTGRGRAGPGRAARCGRVARRRPVLRRRPPAGDRPRHGRPPPPAAAGRAGRRAEPRRTTAARPPWCAPSARRHHRAAGGARHGLRDGHLRRRDRAQLRPPHLRRRRRRPCGRTRR